MCNMEQGTKTSPVAETWRPVKGYEGYYEVSDLARVRSLDHTSNTIKGLRHLRGKILSQRSAGNDYKMVELIIDGVHCSKLVHRLVAEAFIPNPDNLPCINHKDEDKTNNLPSNLEWCDHVYNNNYGTAKQRMALTKSTPIEQLTLDGEHVAFYNSSMDAERKSNGKFAAGNIRTVIIGKRKTAYGYQWRSI